MIRIIPLVEQSDTKQCLSQSVYCVLIGLVISCKSLDINTKRGHSIGCAPKSSSVFLCKEQQTCTHGLRDIF
jgi:hypothetical protein